MNAETIRNAILSDPVANTTAADLEFAASLGRLSTADVLSESPTRVPGRATVYLPLQYDFTVSKNSSLSLALFQFSILFSSGRYSYRGKYTRTATGSSRGDRDEVFLVFD